MIKLPDIMRSELIAIAEASKASTHPLLKAKVAELKTAGQYTEATEDELESFDEALDKAEDDECIFCRGFYGFTPDEDRGGWPACNSCSGI